jgi:hypothetical protein
LDGQILSLEARIILRVQIPREVVGLTGGLRVLLQVVRSLQFLESGRVLGVPDFRIEATCIEGID